ncbi:MAG: hypothetical protein R3C45_03170 [Phycisphaerales bacterium]
MRYLLPLSAVLIGTAPVLADTAASALSRPMPKDRAYEFSADAWGQSKGESEQTNLDARLSSYEATGRFRLDPDVPGSPVAAISWSQLNTHSSDPVLPDELTDISLAASVVRDLEDDWTLRITAGGGFAGDNAFADGSAFYGLANVTANHSLGEGRGYSIGIDYNGNRSVFPDIPLPTFVYYDRLNDTLSYAVGLPSSVTWAPDSNTTARAVITPGGITGSIEHDLDDRLTLFALFDNSVRSFHLDTDDGDRRLFFKQNRVEGGIVWRGTQGDSFPGVEVRAAVGYAFSQEFSRGWDTRDDDTVRDISDEPYLRVGVTMGF